MSEERRMLIAGLFLGCMIGLAIFSLVIVSYNDPLQQRELRTMLVELGVGYYDTQSGEFHTKECTK